MKKTALVIVAALTLGATTAPAAQAACEIDWMQVRTYVDFLFGCSARVSDEEKVTDAGRTRNGKAIQRLGGPDQSVFEPTDKAPSPSAQKAPTVRLGEPPSGPSPSGSGDG